MNMESLKIKIVVKPSRSGGTVCCVPGCKSNSKTDHGVSFHAFPKEHILRDAWISAIKNVAGGFKQKKGKKKIIKWLPAKWDKVCGFHFNRTGKKSYGEYVPTIFNNKKTLSTHVTEGGIEADDVTDTIEEKIYDDTLEKTDTEALVYTIVKSDEAMNRSKSGKGSSRKRPPDCTLMMECHDEPLSKEQTQAHRKAEEELAEVQLKLSNMMTAQGGEIIEKGDNVFVVQMTTPAPPSVPVTTVVPAGAPVKATTLQTRPGPGVLIAPQPTTGSVILQTPTSSVVTRGGAGNTLHTSAGTYQLVMDTRLGLIATPTPASTSIPPLVQSTTVTSKQASSQAITQTRTITTTRTTPVRMAPGTNNKTPVQAKPATPTVVAPNLRLKAKSLQNMRPTENNSIGGILAGNSKSASKPPPAPTVAPIVDLTDDSAPSPAVATPDSREVTFNKLSGKTFPSLVVVARPHLKMKDMPQSAITAERTSLDMRVKNILMLSPTKFTEWLIQQGLVRAEQHCSTHCGSDGQPVKLKLGMYSDVSKFPYSGGYVWISECCPQRFVSVFSGSIFEGAPHPPTVLLKLIYHWGCQTNVQNVVQWVKVDNFYVKNLFTSMRSVCSAAVHEKYGKIGGARKRVEVGVISLGTTSQDGNSRQVKVEVLGVMEPEGKLIRLRAVEPPQDVDRNYKHRFVKILEPLEQWVEKDSIILTDFTVDKVTLHNMGFSTVYQVSGTDTSSATLKYSNQNVMEYLRRIVPRMFQNTLSLLSRQIIQQFLDELVWRERWGAIANEAYDNIITHMAEQTRLDSGESLLTRLGRVAANPFKNWRYANWKANAPAPLTNGTAPQTPATPQANHRPAPAPVPEMRSSIDMLPQSIRQVSGPSPTNSGRGRKRKLNAAPILIPTTTVPLDSQVNEKQTSVDAHYYGSLRGNPKLLALEYKAMLNMKCCLCPAKFTNNLLLMKHVISHVICGQSPITDDLIYCKYCLKTYTTNAALQIHIEEIHVRTNASWVCRLCAEKFRDRNNLVTHMHSNHVPVEMPYNCQICKHRTSFHRNAVDHFYQAHSGGESMECPFCLKVVAVGKRGKKISTNVSFFYNHLQKHMRKLLVVRCTKCSLRFIHRGVLKEHQAKDHISFRGNPDVEAILNSSWATIMMPIPPPPPRGPLSKVGSVRSVSPLRLGARINHNSTRMEGLKVDAGPLGLTCCECEGELCGDEHFSSYLSCTLCRFATCCLRAMAEHSAVFHEALAQSFYMGRATNLAAPLHCVCGYTSRSGNAIAKHLAVCQRKSAYPSAASAKSACVQSASFPPLVTLDDNAGGEDPSDRWLKAFAPARKEDSSTDKQPEGASMLNMLGLVRKPSTDESSEGLPENCEGPAGKCSPQPGKAEPSEVTKMEPEAEENMETSAGEFNTGAEEDGIVMPLCVVMETDD